MSPNAAQLQMPAAPIRTYNTPAPGAMTQPVAQPMSTAQPYMGTQLPQQQTPHQQLPASEPAMFPGVQAVAHSPVGSNPTVGQIQQQAYQQPLIQQPMMQPPPIRQPQQTMPSWPQAMNQAGPAATVNSPASVQYR
jgi:hypothetical protein